MGTKPLFVPVHQRIQRIYTSNTGPTLYLNATLDVNFTATGSLSVNNPVSVAARVTSNDTNFMDHYLCLGFTNSYNASNKVQFSCLTFTSLGNNKYSAAGSLVWLVEGPSWSVIAPRGNFALTTAQSNVGDPAIYISGVSDTLSIASSENNERLTWVLVAFSILSAQSIIEAIWVRDKTEKTAPEPAKSEGRWHWYKKWRKSQLKENKPITPAHTPPLQ